MNKKYTDDDFCDIYSIRICDNCGDCLEQEGIDTKAINIEEISKNIEENKFLEEELKKLYEDALLQENSSEDEALDFEIEADLEANDDYVDAFEHIEYLDDLDINDDALLEDMTEEIFPGVRRLKSRRD